MTSSTRPNIDDAGSDKKAGSPIQECSQTLWVEINHQTEYPGDHGQIEPAAGTPYRLTFGDGSSAEGTLDQNGFARFEGIPAGTVRVEYEPGIDDKISELRQQLQRGLDEILEAERKEYRQIEQELDRARVLGLDFWGSNRIAKGAIYTGAFMEGLWNGAVGILEFTWEVLKGAGKLLYEVSLRVNPITAPQKFKEDIQALRAAHQEFQRFIDEDLEAYAILMTEPETYSMFQKFGTDLVAAQHYLEMTEAGGEMVFDLALTIITGGAGAAANTRHLGKIKKLKEVVDKLVDALKRKKRRQKIERDEPNRKIPTRIQLERVPCFCPFNDHYKSLSPAERREYLSEYSRQLQRQQDAINKMTAQEFEDARTAYDDWKKLELGRHPDATREQRSFRREHQRRIQRNIAADLKVKNPRMGVRARNQEAARRAGEAMKNLDALHESDMVAGGFGKFKPEGMGSSSVNRSIGANWNRNDRLKTMDNHARHALQAGSRNARMKVKLEACRGARYCP